MKRAKIEVGDYIRLNSGVFGLVTDTLNDEYMDITFLWNRGKEQYSYVKLSYVAYNRHATVNEITAAKLMGLV